MVDDGITAGQLGFNSVNAFTAIFPGFKHDESLLVRELMSTCKHIQHIELKPEANDLLNNLSLFITAMGEPVQSTTSFVHWQIMKAVHEQGIKVLINGQGADEAFAGYGPTIVGYRLLDILLSQPSSLFNQINSIKDKMGLSTSTLISQTAKAMLGRRAASKWRAAIVEKGTQVLSSAFIQQHDQHLLESSMNFTANNLDQHLRMQIEHYGFNQILHYEDHSAMANSIEIRSPFIDYRLIEFAFNLPDRLKFDRGITKLIQRLAFSERLPNSIIDNHCKIGFATPFLDWIQDPLLHSFIADIFNSPSFQSRHIWKANEVKQRFHQINKYKTFPFWRYINLELWARAYNINNI